MSRGGRGGGRGGKRGPDLSWQDEDLDDTPQIVGRLKPGPLYPERYIKVPKPLSEREKSSVKALLQLRDRIRSGPLYTVLEPSNLLDSKGRSNARAGFDPFNDQERFTKRYHRKRRVVPDIAERPGYTLKLFPVELWPILDPKRRQKEYWDTIPEDVKARLSGKQGTKRKRTEKLRYDDHDITTAAEARSGSEDENNEDPKDDEDDDEDAILTGNRRRKRTANKTRKTDPTAKDAKQKKGLDAEDDYPDVDQAEGDEAGGEAGDDEPQDSEFGTDEDEDGAEDDYNAEQYFDDGEGDDFADAGGDDDGGGGGGEWYS